MKLGIFGDSFADINCISLKYHDENSKPWPKTLSMLMGADANFFGISGTSLWYSYKLFTREYKNFDYIVFTYTNHNRWNSINDDLNTLSHIISKEQIEWVKQNNTDKNYIDSAKKLVDVHPILFSEEFNIFVYQTIFDNVNKICKENNIKLVNLMPFETSKKFTIDISSRHGPCVCNLKKLSENEKIYQEFGGGDIRYCHLNPTNNNLVAKTIYDLWNTTNIVELV